MVLRLGEAARFIGAACRFLYADCRLFFNNPRLYLDNRHHTSNGRMVGEQAILTAGRLAQNIERLLKHDPQDFLESWERTNWAVFSKYNTHPPLSEIFNRHGQCLQNYRALKRGGEEEQRSLIGSQQDIIAVSTLFLDAYAAGTGEKQEFTIKARDAHNRMESCKASMTNEQRRQDIAIDLERDIAMLQQCFKPLPPQGQQILFGIIRKDLAAARMVLPGYQPH